MAAYRTAGLVTGAQIVHAVRRYAVDVGENNMDATDIKRQNLIIGGAIKAATSSVFTYLIAHPQICGSSVKETMFFLREYSGDTGRDRASYSRYFSPGPDQRVVVEASPNYLSHKEDLAPRIRTLLPEARLLFILRDPVDRLYSYYNFAMSQLRLPEHLTFSDYVDLCARYSERQLSPQAAGIGEAHLRALESGCYSEYLKRYTALFPAQQIKVAFFDHLNRDVVQFMKDVCRFVDVDPNFYDHYTFSKVNVTFSARLRPVHAVALGLNRALETVLRRRPRLKSGLVRFYKRFNQDREGYEPMREQVRARLAEYYAPCNRELSDMLSHDKLPAWVK